MNQGSHEQREKELCKKNHAANQCYVSSQPANPGWQRACWIVDIAELKSKNILWCGVLCFDILSYPILFYPVLSYHCTILSFTTIQRFNEEHENLLF